MKPIKTRLLVFSAAAALAALAFLFGAFRNGAPNRARAEAKYDLPAATDNVYVNRLLADSRKETFRALPLDQTENSADCAPCHATAYRQWRYSAHAFAARTLPFQKVAAALMERHGAEKMGPHCASCHDPGPGYAEDVSVLIDPEHAAKSEGVGCRACHYLNEAPGKNGWFSLQIPRSDLFFKTATERAGYILSAIPEHVKDNAKPISFDGTMCYSCHFLESMRNGEVKVPLDNVNSFLNSSFSKQMACHKCHMPRVEKDENGYAWMDHRFFGIQLELPNVAIGVSEEEKQGLEKFTEDNLKWLNGELEAMDVETDVFDRVILSRRGDLWHKYKYLQQADLARQTAGVTEGGSHFELALEEAELKGGELRAVFSALNVNVSHNFPSQLFANITEMWLETEVEDATGRKIYFSGFDGENLDHQFGRVEIDESGHSIMPIDSLKYVDIINQRYLEPEVKRMDEHAIPIDANVQFPLTAHFRIMYRRYADRFVEWMTGGEKKSMPVKTIAEKTFAIEKEAAERK